MLNTIKKIIAEENLFEIPWSTTLQTIDGDRVCLVSNVQANDDYPIVCLIDYGTEVGCDSYTLEGEYDVGVATGNNLVPIPK